MVRKVRDLVKMSHKATCGVMEKELTVKAANVSSAKAKLRNAGFRIIGTSEPSGPTRKIWFIVRGGF
jgi:tRNA G18 (ribose-2'-O)-methylase SpoU|tara:strand:+ start:12962 stop:13162 length:201 start_codon:yes stop_codon:yes gene_type:complete